MDVVLSGLPPIDHVAPSFHNDAIVLAEVWIHQAPEQLNGFSPPENPHANAIIKPLLTFFCEETPLSVPDVMALESSKYKSSALLPWLGDELRMIAGPRPLPPA
jgi:hypothetical protein